MGRVWDLPLRAIEGETLALTTTAAYASVLPEAREVLLYCSTAWRLALCPALRACVYYDASVDLYTPYLTDVTDKSSSTHLPLDAMQTGDYVYLGFSDRVLGFYIDMSSNVNAEVASLDVEYSSTAQVRAGQAVTTAAAFTDVAGDSDGTATSTVTLSKDGVYTFTLLSKSAWKRTAIDKVSNEELIWIRFCPSAALSATVDINEIIPVYQNTSYGYMQAAIEYSIPFDPKYVGGILGVHTSTGTLNLSWIK